ncbi:MAG: hypothetical protein ACRDIB_20295, partial [Ardenticatenaceae bacterium]
LKAISLALTLLGVLLLRPLPVQMASPPLPTAQDFVEVSDFGLGDRLNSGSWSMQWWNGKLYVGTARAFECWIWASLAAEFPGIPNPGFCPDPISLLDLQAEIWRYTPETQDWERLFESPEILPDPEVPGNFIARDVGFRDMTLFTEQDGTEALYVSAVFPHIVLPDDPPPPRLLRSVDGVTFEAVPQGEDPEGLGATDRPSFSRLTVHDGRLYIIDGTIRGDGTVWASANPEQGLDSFYQVTTDDISVFETASFNGYFYIGTNSDVISPTVAAPLAIPSMPLDAQRGEQPAVGGGEGYEVFRINTSGEPPYTLVPVVTNGGYLNDPSNGVLSMVEYDGALYVGTDDPPEIIRVNPDDSWTLIVGDTRVLPNGDTVQPTSGFDSGFGWQYNIHVWRMIEHDGLLFAGTLDLSSALAGAPGVPDWLREQLGFDLYVSADGYEFTEITHRGLGFDAQMGVRGLASTPAGLFVGSMAPAEGLLVWRLPSSSLTEKIYLPMVLKRTR